MNPEDYKFLYWVKLLPSRGKPNSLYFLQAGNEFELYCTDKAGFLRKIISNSSTSGIVTDYGLIGIQDNFNKVFRTLSDVGFKTGSTMLYVNGVRQFKGEDYIEVDNFFIELTKAPRPTTKLVLDYSLNDN